MIYVGEWFACATLRILAGRSMQEWFGLAVADTDEK
jgi:hypothetical protein